MGTLSSVRSVAIRRDTAGTERHRWHGEAAGRPDPTAGPPARGAAQGKQEPVPFGLENQ